MIKALCILRGLGMFVTDVGALLCELGQDIEALAVRGLEHQRDRRIKSAAYVLNGEPVGA